MRRKSIANPQRGEVWLIDLGLAGKIRPCLIMSIPLEDTDRALIAVIPHTTSPRGTRFEVVIQSRFLKSGGVFDGQNIITTPSSKPQRRLGALSTFDLGKVESAVRHWLGLSEMLGS